MTANEKQIRAWKCGEFGLIDRIRVRFPNIDLTDDCALLEIAPSKKMLVSTDTSVRGIHFPQNPEFMESAGFKAFAGAVSDINASAGKVIGALLALNLPESLTLAEFDSFIDGIKSFSNRFNIPILGGNISGSTEFSATFTAFGECDRCVTRNGARPGDVLFVIGELGGPEAGRIIVMGEAETTSPHSEIMKNRFLRPEPPLGLGEYLSKIGATAMIDISDGLLADAEHIASESRVAFSIDLASLPLFPGVEDVASQKGIPPYKIAVASGEEYTLLFTLPTSSFDMLNAIPYKFSQIGHVSEGKGIQTFLYGQEIDIKKTGWRHF
ncbi:thiamine-phosphate kinase [bacterium]|nr:thiamine-phosphate kinase [bacterium]